MLTFLPKIDWNNFDILQINLYSISPNLTSSHLYICATHCLSTIIDIIILATSKGGECYLEAKNLNGETNFKPKYAHLQLQKKLYKQLNEKEFQKTDQKFTEMFFWQQIQWGLLQAILLMIISFYAFEPIQPHIDGQNFTYLEAGMTIMSTVVFIVNLIVLLLHNIIYPVIVYINIGFTNCLILFFFLLSIFESFDLFQRLNECINFYLAMILMLTVTNFLDLWRLRYNYFVVQYREHQQYNPPTQLEIEM